MKTKCTKTDWLASLVGIALVAATVAAARAYLGSEQQTHTGEALTATLDRLYQDQQLCMALKTLHEGDAAAAAKRLDQLLCEHIIRLDSERASADARTQGFVEDAFRRMALVRPKTVAGKSADSTAECPDDRLAAERILSRALGAKQTAAAN